jgi:hypothetical protein
MDDHGHLAGHQLPPGHFTVTADEDRRLRAVIGAEADPAGETAHPLWAYIAPQRGIGATVGELCRLADFDILDGPMLGSSELELAQAVQLEVRYLVTGEIVGVTRKHGRKLGTFDVLTYREHLAAPGGARILSVTNTFILPRSGA